MAKKKSSHQPDKKVPVASNIPMPDKKTAPIKKPVNNEARIFLFQKIAIAAVAFLLYIGSMHYDFNMDDSFYTTPSNAAANAPLNEMKNVFRQHTIHDDRNTYDFRPVAMISFILQHHFISPSARAGHIINTLIYALICLVIFTVLCKWFGPTRRWFAFFVTLLFTVHPLHTEVVSSIKSRDELLMMLFSFTSLYLAWLWYEKRKWYFIPLYGFLMLLALLCKQSALPFVVIAPLAFYFFSDLSLKKAIPAVIIIIACCYTIVRVMIVHMPKQVRIFYSYENPFHTGAYSHLLQFSTGFYILGRYLWLHIIPYPLLFYYGYKYIPVIGWNNVWVWISLLIHLALGIYALLNLRKKSIAAFGILFYLIAIFPYSNLTVLLPGMMAERFVFVASLGFCIMACTALYAIFRTKLSSFNLDKNGKYLITTLVAICTVYSVRSYTRSKDWENTYTLFSHDMPYLHESAKANMMYSEVSMNKYFSYNQAAIATHSQLYADSAAFFLQETKESALATLKMYPAYVHALNNLGVVYFTEDSFEKAKNLLMKGRKYSPDDPDINYNLGLVSVQLNNNDSAVMFIQNAIKAKPKYLVAYRDLCDHFLKMKDTSQAINIMRQAISNNPKEQAPLSQLANIYMMKNDTLNAIYYCEKAAALPPPNTSIISFLQSYFTATNNVQKANYYRSKLNEIQNSNEQ